MWDCSLIMRQSLDEMPPAQKGHKHKSKNVHLDGNINQIQKSKSNQLKKASKQRYEENEKTKQAKKKTSLKSKNTSRTKINTNQSDIKIQASSRTNDSQIVNSQLLYSPTIVQANRKDTNTNGQPLYSVRHNSRAQDFRIIKSPLRGNDSKMVLQKVCFKNLCPTASSTNPNIVIGHPQPYQQHQASHNQKIKPFCIESSRLGNNRGEKSNNIQIHLYQQVQRPQEQKKIIFTSKSPKQRIDSQISFKNIIANKNEKENKAEKQNFRTGGNIHVNWKFQNKQQKQKKPNFQSNFNDVIKTRQRCLTEESELNIKNQNLSQKKRIRIEDFLNCKEEIESVRDSQELSQQQNSQVVIRFADYFKQHGKLDFEQSDLYFNN